MSNKSGMMQAGLKAEPGQHLQQHSLQPDPPWTGIHCPGHKVDQPGVPTDGLSNHWYTSSGKIWVSQVVGDTGALYSLLYPKQRTLWRSRRKQCTPPSVVLRASDGATGHWWPGWRQVRKVQSKFLRPPQWLIQMSLSPLLPAQTQAYDT